MNKEVLQAIQLHAELEYPKECCGLIGLIDDTPVYFPCVNEKATAQDDFRIGAQDWCKVEHQVDRIVAIVHSHPDESAQPSEADRVSCELHGLPWYIQEVREGKCVGEPLKLSPCGYQAPLIGRTFHHGILDCLQIVLDYYKREEGVDLGTYDREDGWWDAGKDYYRELLPKAGFYPVDTLQQGDIILMQIRSPVPNHAGIYLADGTLKTEDCYPQPGCVLHHLYGRLSRRDVYGGYWADVTVGYWRYKK